MFRNKKSEQFFKDTLKKLIRNQRNERLKSIAVKYEPTELTDSTGRTPLHLAAKYNNVDLIEFLIEKVTYDIDGKDSQGMTPLMIALLYNNYNAIECLLEYSADVFTTNAAGNSALKMISKTHYYTARTLQLFFDRVRSRYNTNEETANKLAEASFPLDFVVELQNAQVTKLILEKGKPIEEHERYGSTLNAFRSLDVENIKVLVDLGVAMRRGGRNYFFQFFNKYVRAKNPEKWNHVKVLTPKLIEWNLVNDDTIRFCEKSFEKAQLEPLKIFLECGLLTHIKQKLNYDSAVHFFGNRNINVFDLLNESDFDINARGRGDSTALHWAVANGVVKNVKYLLENGADPNSKNRQGKTPILMSLVRAQSPYGDDSVECVRLLLEYDADPQIVDELGRCFFDIYDTDDRRAPVIEIIIARIALLDASGVNINKTVYECIHTDEFLKGCYKICQKQIKVMKNFKICNSLTALNVLSKRPGQIARIVGTQDEESIKALLNSEALQRLNYYYHSTLVERLLIAALVDRCRNNVADIIGDNMVLLQRNTVIIDKIISNLTLKDLLVFDTKA